MALTTTKTTSDSVSTSSKSSSRKSYIAPNDVLMGRGARATENEGNVRFRQIVRSRLHDYLTAPRRQDKDQIAREILGLVKSRNGRFLRKVESLDDSQQGNGSDFVSVEDDVALLKVKQALRDQKLEEANNSSSRAAVDVPKSVSPALCAKVAGSPLNGQGMLGISGLASPAGIHPLLAGATMDELLLRQYLNEQARSAVIPAPVYPEASTADLLAARLGLPQSGVLSPSTTLLLEQAARNEALVRSALAAENNRCALQALALNGLRNTAPGAPAPTTPPAIDLEASINLLQQSAGSLAQSSLLTRAAGFQGTNDLLDAQRLFKRRKTN